MAIEAPKPPLDPVGKSMKRIAAYICAACLAGIVVSVTWGIIIQGWQIWIKVALLSVIWLCIAVIISKAAEQKID